VQPDILRPGAIPRACPPWSIGGVSHSYGPRRALIDVNFTVAPASFTALLGLNGAGKSTLFSLITRCSESRPGISAFSATTSAVRQRGAAVAGGGVPTRTLDLDLSSSRTCSITQLCTASPAGRRACAARRC